jgi:hypothetical protein
LMSRQKRWRWKSSSWWWVHPALGFEQRGGASCRGGSDQGGESGKLGLYAPLANKS